MIVTAIIVAAILVGCVVVFGALCETAKQDENHN